MIEEYCNKWGILPECLHIVECKEGNEHYTYAGGNINAAKEGDYILVTDDLLTFSVRKVTDVFTNKEVMKAVLTNAVKYSLKLADKVSQEETLNQLLEEKLGVSLSEVNKALKEFKHDNLE